jgi:hypothetical protein
MAQPHHSGGAAHLCSAFIVPQEDFKLTLAQHLQTLMECWTMAQPHHSGGAAHLCSAFIVPQEDFKLTLAQHLQTLMECCCVQLQWARPCTHEADLE